MLTNHVLYKELYPKMYERMCMMLSLYWCAKSVFACLCASSRRLHRWRDTDCTRRNQMASKGFKSPHTMSPKANARYESDTYVCMHTYIHAYIHTYVHTCIHYMHTYVYIHIYWQKHRICKIIEYGVCVCVCARACVRACVYLCIISTQAWLSPSKRHQSVAKNKDLQASHVIMSEEVRR